MGASDRTTVDFGAFPGSPEAFVDVSAPGVVAGSEVEAWMLPIATADHSIDEHEDEEIRVVGRFLSNDNIRIRAYAQEYPLLVKEIQNKTLSRRETAQAHRQWGLWTIGWGWN